MKNIIILTFILFISVITKAQVSNEELTVSDSIRNSLIQSQSQLLVNLYLKLTQDSVQKQQLLTEIKQLSNSNQKKKQDLLEQLSIINQKDSSEKAKQLLRIDSLKKIITGYPVMPFGDTLFYIYNRIGGFSSRERAKAISNRIQVLADRYQFSEDSFHLEKVPHATEILYGEQILMSVLLSDAVWGNLSPDSLANQTLGSIKNAISKYRQVNSTPNKLKRTGWIILVLAFVGVLVFFINFLFKKSNKWFENHLEKGINGIKINNYTLFNSNQELKIVLWLSNILKWILNGIIVYLSLPLIFSILPWAEGITDTLIGYIVNPTRNVIQSIWNYLPNLFTIVVLSTIIVYIKKGFFYLSKEIESGSLKIDGFYKDWAKPTYQIISILLFAFLIIVIFPYLPGSESPVFKGVSVFLGLLFTFGSSGSLSNIISGLVLTYTRAFKLGDRVKIGEIIGDVIEKSLLVTRIQTTKNEIISIPNTNVMNSHTTNFSSEVRDGKLLTLYTSVSIGYDVPWMQVQQLLIDAAIETSHIEKEPLPFVLKTSLDDFYISYQINAYTKAPNLQNLIYSNLHGNIIDKFNKANVEILSPHYNAIRDGNTSTVIPPSNIN